MTGADLISVIILIGLAGAIAVYLLHWLNRRSSKEVSFVRSGLGGEKVVISGGAFVLPIIHNVTSVGMRTLRIEVSRSGEKSFITKNRMRVELVAEFYVRVIPTEEAVSTAARSLGNRTLDGDALRELVQGRFVDALGNVAAQMSMDDMQERRGEYVSTVETLVEASLADVVVSSCYKWLLGTHGTAVFYASLGGELWHPSVSVFAWCLEPRPGER